MKKIVFLSVMLLMVALSGFSQFALNAPVIASPLDKVLDYAKGFPHNIDNTDGLLFITIQDGTLNLAYSFNGGNFCTGMMYSSKKYSDIASVVEWLNNGYWKKVDNNKWAVYINEIGYTQAVLSHINNVWIILIGS